MAEIIPEIMKNIAAVVQPIALKVHGVDQAGSGVIRLHVDLEIRANTIQFGKNSERVINFTRGTGEHRAKLTTLCDELAGADIINQSRLERNAFRLGFKAGCRGLEATPNHRAHPAAFESGRRVGAELSLRMIDAFLTKRKG